MQAILQFKLLNSEDFLLFFSLWLIDLSGLEGCSDKTRHLITLACAVGICDEFFCIFWHFIDQENNQLIAQ